MSQAAGNYRRPVTTIPTGEAREQFTNQCELTTDYPKHEDTGIDIIRLGTIVSIAGSCGVFDYGQ